VFGLMREAPIVGRYPKDSEIYSIFNKYTFWMQQSDTVNTEQQNRSIKWGIVLAFIFIPVAGLLLYKMELNIAKLFYSRLIHWSTVAVLFLYAYKIERQPFLLWKEHYYKMWFYWGSIFGLFVITFLLGFVSTIPIRLGYHDDFTVMFKLKAIMKHNRLLMVFGAITAGITEELIIRGYILPRLSLFFKNAYLPVLISAAMFSALHLGYHNLYELLFTFLLGLLTGIHYKRYRNIKVLILFHALFDTMAFMH
jgi:membrane protease YdiL (CAAX protease family)